MLSRLVMQSPMQMGTIIKSSKQLLPIRQQIVRQFARDGRQNITRNVKSEKMSLKERIMAPAGPNGINSRWTYLINLYYTEYELWSIYL